MNMSTPFPAAPVDLDLLEIWLARHCVDSAPMATLLLQFERMVRVAFGGELEIGYAAARVDGALEVSIEVWTRGAMRCSAILGLCCRAGRFFKRYGPSPEERIFFKGPKDAAQYVLFVLGQRSAAERSLSSGSKALRSVRTAPRTSIRRTGG